MILDKVHEKKQNKTNEGNKNKSWMNSKNAKPRQIETRMEGENQRTIYAPPPPHWT